MQIADRRRFLRARKTRLLDGSAIGGPDSRGVRFRSLSGESWEHERQTEWIGAGYADEAHAIGELARARRSGLRQARAAYCVGRHLTTEGHYPPQFCGWA